MNNKALFLVLGVALISATGAQMLSIWHGQEPYLDEAQLALTVDRCPEAYKWLAQHSKGAPISNDAYSELASWIASRERIQAKASVASHQPITCRALRDWRDPS